MRICSGRKKRGSVTERRRGGSYPGIGRVAGSACPVREESLSMAGSPFGRLSLGEGDSANSLEGIEVKLCGEGKNQAYI